MHAYGAGQRMECMSRPGTKSRTAGLEWWTTLRLLVQTAADYTQVYAIACPK